MDPAALVLAAEMVVGTVVIGDQVPAKVGQQAGGHCPRPRAVIGVVADRRWPRRDQPPDVAVLAVLAPTRLVHMHDRTGPRLHQQRLLLWSRGLLHALEHIDERPAREA